MFHADYHIHRPLVSHSIARPLSSLEGSGDGRRGKDAGHQMTAVVSCIPKDMKESDEGEGVTVGAEARYSSTRWGQEW